MAKLLSNVESQNTATKQDLEVTKLELKRDIELAKKDLNIWTGTIMAIGVGALAAIIKL